MVEARARARSDVVLETAPDKRRAYLTARDVLGAKAELDRLPWGAIDPVPDYFLEVIASRPEALGPVVVRVPQCGSEIAFAGRLEEIPLTVSVGYRDVYRPRARAVTLVPGGVVGADSEPDARSLLEILRATVRDVDGDVLWLPALRVGSPLHAAAAAAPALLRGQFRRRTTHWTLRLPNSFDDFMAARSKKTRENLRRYSNRLVRDHGDDLSLRVFTELGEIDELFQQVELVAAKTYQRGLGVALADTEEHRRMIELGLRQGWFRAYMLSLRGHPVAFWPGTSFRGTFSIGTPGYDPALAEYRIGTYVLLRVIEELCTEDGMDVLDFGFGESEYKRRLGSDSWEEEDMLVFSPTFRGIRINATRTLVAGGAALARTVAEKTGVAGRLKRRLRSRLASEGQTSPVG
jgi:CelD/BcsL family acetyltransferase involved in cellulose biosynthesis